MSRIRAAVVGLGYWGPNLARNIQASGDYELVGLCDTDPRRLARAGDLYPWARRYESLPRLLEDGRPEFIAVATPVASHHALVRAALEAGCHVLCAKPLAAGVAEAADLVATAARVGRRLFVDHTFLFTNAVRSIGREHARGTLGDLFYVDSVRINLGLFQSDVDVVWDLAPHDLSILSHVLRSRVRSLQATGATHNPHRLADVAWLALEYETGLQAHLHLSWLSPVKVRRMLFSGTRSSIIYDDVEPSEKVKIYDQGVEFELADAEQRKQVLVNYRRGDMRAPALDAREALAIELHEIGQALKGSPVDVATAEAGLEIVRVLEACQRSMAAEGGRVRVTYD